MIIFEVHFPLTEITLASIVVLVQKFVAHIQELECDPGCPIVFLVGDSLELARHGPIDVGQALQRLLFLAGNVGCGEISDILARITIARTAEKTSDAVVATVACDAEVSNAIVVAAVACDAPKVYFAIFLVIYLSRQSMENASARTKMRRRTTTTTTRVCPRSRLERRRHSSTFSTRRTMWWKFLTPSDSSSECSLSVCETFAFELCIA